MKYRREGQGEVTSRKDYTKRVIFPRESFADKAHEVQIVTVPPHTSITPHSHTRRTEVFFVLEGEASLQIGQSEHQARPGDAFVCEPGDRHYASNMTDREFRLLVFKINLASEDDTVWEEAQEASAAFEIVELSTEHRRWAADLVRDHWGSEKVVTRGKVWDTTQLPGFVALLRGDPAGLATYRICDQECEIVSLDSLAEGTGIGTALVERVAQKARDQGCRRVWLITTNDNMDAVRFYQKRGFRLVAVHPDAFKVTRRLKPGLPETGIEGIPLRDEIELEILLHER
jgi:quercetin dioxygenase-like cupin family protein